MQACSIGNSIRSRRHRLHLYAHAEPAEPFLYAAAPGTARRCLLASDRPGYQGAGGPAAFLVSGGQRSHGGRGKMDRQRWCDRRFAKIGRHLELVDRLRFDLSGRFRPRHRRGSSIVLRGALGSTRFSFLAEPGSEPALDPDQLIVLLIHRGFSSRCGIDARCAVMSCARPWRCAWPAYR
jgi:hypothetical protein